MRWRWSRSMCVSIGASGWICLAAALGALPAGPAAAQFGPNTLLVGVGQTSGSGSADIAALGPGFGDLLITDIVALKNDDPRFRNCDIAVLEWRRRGDVLKEYELRRSGRTVADPAKVGAPPPEPTALIEGSLTEAGGSVSWTIEMRDRASGKVLGKSDGTLPADQVFEASAAVARDMLAAACPPGAFAVRAKIDDLVIDTVVCDSSGPFQIVSQAGGATATISFTPTAGQSGTYSYAGQVAGIPASGGGEYVIELKDDGTGTLVINGVFTVKSPMGSFSKTGPETMTLSPPGASCG